MEDIKETRQPNITKPRIASMQMITNSPVEYALPSRKPKDVNAMILEMKGSDTPAKSKITAKRPIMKRHHTKRSSQHRPQSEV